MAEGDDEWVWGESSFRLGIEPGTDVLFLKNNFHFKMAFWCISAVY